jgi:F-type H+-transporting ATPase subunit b
MASPALASSIFLIPNGTFFVELIIFVIVLLVLGWYVAPAIGKALRDRDEMIKRATEESQAATEKLAAAEATRPAPRPPASADAVARNWRHSASRRCASSSRTCGSWRRPWPAGWSARTCR